MKSVLLAFFRYHRNYHAGVAEFALENGWHLDAQMTVNQQLPKTWNGDGIISSLVPDKKIVAKVAGLKLPTVSIGPSYMNCPCVGTDAYESADKVFTYFRTKGFRNFAFYQEYPGKNFEPVISLRKILDENGFSIVDLTPDKYFDNWEDRSRALYENLKVLNFPAAVFCTRDNGGSEIIEVCHKYGIKVPEEISVMGRQNDTLICETMRTALTSLDVNMKMLGYKAAEQLKRLMDGEQVESFLAVSPGEIVERRSTSSVAVDHKGIQEALFFIRNNYSRPVSVNEIALSCCLSERSLHRLFKQETGQTIKSVIQNVRMTEACRLLKFTDFTVEYIASICGYPEVRNFYKAFRRCKGCTPDQYRKSV